MRKILILEKEEINIKNIHREIETYIEPHYYIKIDQINSKIHNYLSKKINLATNFVVDMWEENTNVKSFLNDFYFGFIEHSSRDAQLRFTIVNALYFWQGTEMARIMMVELNKLLQKYWELMIEWLNKSKDKNLG